jgi:DNA-binding NarL/FixJ family response regulator
MEQKIRVAIVDDHQSTVDGYGFRLSQLNNIEFAGTAAFGNEIEPLLVAQPVNVLLLDVHVPTSLDNPLPYPILHTVPKLLRQYPGLSILIISMMLRRSLIEELLAAGISGYILKNDRAAVLTLGTIVEGAAKGELFLSEDVRRALSASIDDENVIRLTPRQQEALSLCAAHPHWTHVDLANHISVAHSTARNMLHSAYVRLGVGNLAAAIDKARRLGLITPLEPV